MANQVVISPEEKLLHEIFRPMSAEEKTNCDGFKQTNCCNAPHIENTDYCSACKEHASNECEDCEEQNCPNRVNYYE